MDANAAIAVYNRAASHFGWLPVGISAHDCALQLRSAARRIRALRPDVAAALDDLAATKPTPQDCPKASRCWCVG